MATGLPIPGAWGSHLTLGSCSIVQQWASPNCACVGKHDEPELERGSRRPLVDKDEVIGAVVRTRDRVKPVFASVGHKIVLDQAVEYVFQCGAGYWLLEPTRLAHQAAAGQLKA